MILTTKTGTRILSSRAASTEQRRNAKIIRDWLAFKRDMEYTYVPSEESKQIPLVLDGVDLRTGRPVEGAKVVAKPPTKIVTMRTRINYLDRALAVSDMNVKMTGFPLSVSEVMRLASHYEMCHANHLKAR